MLHINKVSRLLICVKVLIKGRGKISLRRISMSGYATLKEKEYLLFQLELVNLKPITNGNLEFQDQWSQLRL